MSKSSVIQRELKRKKLVVKYAQKRAKLRSIIFNKFSTKDEKWGAQIKIQKLPRNSSSVRLVNRCRITGKSKGVYKKFGLCRNSLRRHAMVGNILGLKKSSW